MSGIYIPGMEMPTDENEAIDIRLFSDGNIAAWNKQKGWVPYSAIPVPEHGRLVDADALWVEIHKICDRRDSEIISDLTCLQQILSAVRHAPTIIPADKEAHS